MGDFAGFAVGFHADVPLKYDNGNQSMARSPFVFLAKRNPRQGRGEVCGRGPSVRECFYETGGKRSLTDINDGSSKPTQIGP
jgi:hypothetical protein